MPTSEQIAASRRRNRERGLTDEKAAEFRRCNVISAWQRQLPRGALRQSAAGPRWRSSEWRGHGLPSEGARMDCIDAWGGPDPPAA